MKMVLKRQPSNKRPNVFNIEISKFFGARDILIRMMCNKKKGSMLMILWTIIYVGNGYYNTIITTIVVFGGVLSHKVQCG
jgi:hypothetical protein